MHLGTLKVAAFLAVIATTSLAQEPRSGAIFEEANRRQAAQEQARRTSAQPGMKHVKLPPSGASSGSQVKKSSAALGSPNVSPPAAQMQMVDQPQPAPPPAPLRPSQMPALAPRISYQAGYLTVVAENSTFADVINSIRNATNIPIETTGGPTGDRIAVQIGPAPVKDVLLALMEGSRFDFVIVGSETDPNGVSRVLLTPKIAGGSSQPVPQQQRAAAPMQPGIEIQTEDDDSNEGFATPVAPAQKVIPPDQQGQTAQPVNPAQPKTPEQLMEELKRLEQQRQMQQNVTPGQPVQQRPTRPIRP